MLGRRVAHLNATIVKKASTTTKSAKRLKISKKPGKLTLSEIAGSIMTRMRRSYPLIIWAMP
jgi:hypothetical protein